jgi:hypothetical protein
LSEASTPQKDDLYIQNCQLVTKQVANCLFRLLPAKRLAQTAKTMLTGNGNGEKVNLETFIENLFQDNKWQNTHTSSGLG